MKPCDCAEMTYEPLGGGAPKRVTHPAHSCAYVKVRNSYLAHAGRVATKSGGSFSVSTFMEEVDRCVAEYYAIRRGPTAAAPPTD